MAEPDAIGVPSALDIRAVDGYDEIAVRAARPRTAGWIILQLVVWAVLALSTFISSRTVFSAFLVWFWAVFLVVYAVYLVWAFVGVKRIAVINRNLWVGHKFFRWTLSRAYRGVDIREFRVCGPTEASVSRWRRSSGLEFTYKTRSVSIHFDLDAPDVQRLVDLVKARLAAEAIGLAPER